MWQREYEPGSSRHMKTGQNGQKHGRANPRRNIVTISRGHRCDGAADQNSAAPFPSLQEKKALWSRIDEGLHRCQATDFPIFYPLDLAIDRHCSIAKPPEF